MEGLELRIILIGPLDNDIGKIDTADFEVKRFHTLNLQYRLHQASSGDKGSFEVVIRCRVRCLKPILRVAIA